MTSFLNKIAEQTKERVTSAKKTAPAGFLQDCPLFSRKPAAILPAFNGRKTHIIAEVKFASPSEGDIRTVYNPVDIADGYLGAGATMLSVLTEPLYFKGSIDYLRDIRLAHPDARLLRKDFMVDSYQLYEARAAGADAILLICAMTAPGLTRDLFFEARSLGLSPLVEVHDMDELKQAIDLGADFIGVNNRNLKTLKTDIATSHLLAQSKPENAVFISESGLRTADDITNLKKAGYDGFLMGTHFMRHDDPGKALHRLLEECA